MLSVQHSIKTAAKRSGLSPHVIRIWEKRYQAITPARTPTQRRLYSETDIERLSLLRLATHSGHSISNIARLTTDDLRSLAGTTRAAAMVQTPGQPQSVEKLLEDCLAAVRDLNAAALETLLDQGSVAFGQHGLLQKIVAPLTMATGEMWRSGALTAAHEHFATAFLRVHLARSPRSLTVNGIAPRLIVTTPAGQLHELGGIMVVAAANDLGWQATFLGASLPAAEIAGAAIQNSARAVALSIVYPEDDANLAGELNRLRRYLPQNMPILVGGRAVPAYRTTLQTIGATICDNLGDLYSHLESLRSTPSPLPAQ